jgi:hypothetical protein
LHNGRSWCERDRKSKAESVGGADRSVGLGAASAVVAGSWVTQGKKMCSRSELIVSNNGGRHVKLILASDLAKILEEKNLVLVGDGENFQVMHKF